MHVVRVAVAAIFIYAGAIKTWYPGPFADSIASFRLLPNGGIALFALGLPPFEMLSGLLLLMFGKLRRAGAFCTLLMTLIFLFALGSALARGLTVDCGCFGGSSLDLLSPAKNLWLALVRDLLLAASAWLLYKDARHESGVVFPTKTEASPNALAAAP